jgi:hypothetical protein
MTSKIINSYNREKSKTMWTSQFVENLNNKYACNIKFIKDYNLDICDK